MTAVARRPKTVHLLRVYDNRTWLATRCNVVDHGPLDQTCLALYVERLLLGDNSFPAFSR